MNFACELSVIAKFVSSTVATKNTTTDRSVCQYVLHEVIAYFFPYLLQKLGRRMEYRLLSLKLS